MPLTKEDFLKNDIYQILSLLPEDAGTQDRIALIRRWQQVRMEEYGWVGDFVGGDPDMPYALNAHTHGIRENFNHPDLQIVFSLPPNVINGLLQTCVDKIKEGQTFEPGKDYEDIAGSGYKVRFMVATEQDREVLRLIIPGKDGKLAPDEIDPDFAAQYQDTRPNFA